MATCAYRHLVNGTESQNGTDKTDDHFMPPTTEQGHNNCLDNGTVYSYIMAN